MSLTDKCPACGEPVEVVFDALGHGIHGHSVDAEGIPIPGRSVTYDVWRCKKGSRLTPETDGGPASAHVQAAVGADVCLCPMSVWATGACRCGAFG